MTVYIIVEEIQNLDIYDEIVCVSLDREIAQKEYDRLNSENKARYAYGTDRYKAIELEPIEDTQEVSRANSPDSSH